LNSLVSAAFLLVCSALPGFANIITLDENGHGSDNGLALLFNPNGTNPVAPFQRPVLVYTLPFAGVPGQVELIEPESGILEDVLQFTGNGTVIFYSKRDSDNSLADRFRPPIFPVPVTNTVVLTETGSPGNDGAFYTPSNGQPGFDASRPIYHFISNSQLQITKFQHVIVIVQENRTPDNLFHGLCVAPFGSAKSCSTKPDPSQYDIQTRHWIDKNTPSGKTEPKHIPLAAQYDLDHSHAAFLAMCDADPVTGACKMDGAGDVVCSKPICPSKPQFRFVDNSKGILNPYLEIATQYAWANYMFQTNQGPSFPAHQFLFGGTSAPSAFDDASGIFVAENTSKGANKAGCTAPEGTTVALIDQSGQENQKIYPCFEHRTMADVLPQNVTWKYYAPNAGSIWTAPNAIQHVCESTGPGGKCTGLEWQNNVDLVPADVLRDIRDCKLASLAWVVPTGANSDHAALSDGGGPSWVASIVNAIGKSNTCDSNTGYWKNTAILITWDDWGGWYDHVPPTMLAQSSYEYGFRVPLLFVSAYTPKRYINNQRHDFGSILRFIEHNFGIQEGALKFADARAKNDLGGFFDFRRPPRDFQAIAVTKDESFFLNDTRLATDPDDQ
jgi:phospholipase C